MAPKLLTVKDLVDLFQKDDDTIRTWLLEGVFPNAFKIKGGWYVPISDIKKMMKKNGEETDQAEPKQKPAPRVSKGFVHGWK